MTPYKIVWEDGWFCQESILSSNIVDDDPCTFCSPIKKLLGWILYINHKGLVYTFVPTTIEIGHNNINVSL